MAIADEFARWSHAQRIEMANSLESMIGQAIRQVDYYHDEQQSLSVYEGICDVCTYGIEIEITSRLTQHNGIRFKVVQSDWTVPLGETFEETSLFIGTGHVEDDYPLDAWGPIRKKTVSGENRWLPFIGNKIVGIELFSLLLEQRYRIEDIRTEGTYPQHIKIEFESGDSLYVYSGTYDSSYGLILPNIFTLVVAFGEEAHSDLIGSLTPVWDLPRDIG